jgi:hypothetical protein
LIRLDDLIPKQNVRGGRRLFFGATATQPKTQRNNMPQKKETTPTTKKKSAKVQDLAPKKDAKGGGRSFNSAPGPRPDMIKGQG